MIAIFLRSPHAAVLNFDGEVSRAKYEMLMLLSSGASITSTAGLS